MSVPSQSAVVPTPCACTNISLMQLFHELKQKFPGVPDHVVSHTIELYCHDKQACESHLHSEVKASLTHAYHASSSAAAKKHNELRLNPPGKCRNQPIIKHEVSKPTTVQSVTCEAPLTAVISTNDEKNKLPNTDDNQNVVEPVKEIKHELQRSSSETVINIDNCYAKYNTDSPSDLELSNDNTKDDKSHVHTENNEENNEYGSTNYAILKSNKIRSNLNERLDKSKEKKTIRKEKENIPLEVKEIQIPKEDSNIQQEVEEQRQIQEKKPTRPTTLDFIKTNPDIAFKPTIKQDDTCQTVSSTTSQTQNQETKEKVQSQSQVRQSPNQNQNYPLNFQVNVNCHMDYSRAYDPWLEDFDSPRAITSVNLTVCTPTSNMASPIRENRDDSGLEGHVTVTVSPSTARAPRRPAPPPPPQVRPSRLESPRPTRAAPEPPGPTHEPSLIERQKERLGRLAAALAQEKGRLSQLTRETQILAAPPPPAMAKQRLKDYVQRLREQCDTLAKRLELGSGEPDFADSGNFYSNIYTGQRPPSAWQCHMCTFRNHPLLDNCEECDMPRILVGTSPARTHDSGFGSFRDKNRRISSQASQTDLECLPNLVGDCHVAKLNA